jgi:glucosylceramidase
MLLQILKIASLLAVGLPSLSSGSSLPRAVSSAQSWASSADGSLKLSSYTAPSQGSGSGSGISSTWSLRVDDTASGHKQTIDGFGGMS